MQSVCSDLDRVRRRRGRATVGKPGKTVSIEPIFPIRPFYVLPATATWSQVACPDPRWRVAVKPSTVLKLHFRPPTSEWSIDSGFLSRWEALFTRVPQRGAGYALVSKESAADVIVAPSGDQVSGRFWRDISPPKPKEIETVVWDIGDRPLGRESGFFCSLPKQLFDPSRHCTMSYPVAWNDYIEKFAPQQATFDFGFMGSMSAGVRRRIADRFEPVARELNAAIIESSWDRRLQSFAYAPEQLRAYANFIQVTKFVLCPRGKGTGSIRLFEVLKAGRVPVVISDDYVLPTLQGPTAWEDSALFVGERHSASIPSLVSRKLGEWETMAANARRLWEENFSDAKVIELIAFNLARLRTFPPGKRQPTLRRSAKVAAYVLAQQARPMLGRVRALFD